MRSSIRLLFAALAMTIALGSTAGAALAAPTNDNFADAQELAGNRGAAQFDLADATSESSEIFTGGTLTRSVWFRYAPTANGYATFFNCNTDTELVVEDSSIVVFTGGALASLTNESGASGGCTNDRVNSQTPAIAVQAGETYWVQLATTDGNLVTAGSLRYDFNSAPPANDDFADAATIAPALPQTISADTGLASIEPTEPNIEMSGPANSLWYSWTPDQNGTVSIDTCETESSDPQNPADSRLHIYTEGIAGPGLADLEFRQESDDSCDDPNALLSHAYLNVFEGQTYFIRVSNYSAEYGFDYDLNLRWVTAPEVSRPPYVYPTNTRFQPGDSAFTHTGTWAADPEITDVTVEWLRCDAAGANCNVIDGQTGYSYEVQVADIGQTLRARVTGTNGVESVSVQSPPSQVVDEPPANDNFANATDIGSTAPATVADDNYFATSETGENDVSGTWVDRSVWYRWTAPAAKTYVVSSCTSASAPNFAVNVFVGSEVDALASANGGNESCPDPLSGARTYFAADEGTSYAVQAGSSVGEGPMEFTLSISEVPAPSFASGPVLTGDAIEHSTLTLESEAESAIAVSKEVFWTLCDSLGDNCSDLDDITTDDALLTAAMVGKRIRATVTYTNANGSISESVLSDVIEGDADNDGVTDDDDTCPNAAGTRPNGCAPSTIVNAGLPVISGTPQVGSQLTSTAGDWTIEDDPLPFTVSYQWLRCTNAIDDSSCSTIAGATSANYTLKPADLGLFVRVGVVASNADDSSEAHSLPSAAITNPPVAPPVTPPVDPPANPPVATNPLTLTVRKSLGSLTPKKGVITIKGATISCAANAAGACTGSVTLSTTVKKKLKRFVSAKISIAPGKSGPAIIKLSGSQLKAIKKAKSLKFTAVFSLSGPGFPATTANASGTLKPQK